MSVIKSDREKAEAKNRFRYGSHHDTSKYPQTTQVFEAPKVDFNNHAWIQRGYVIYDTCNGCIPQAIPIPVGKSLTKKDGRYTFVDERS